MSAAAEPGSRYRSLDHWRGFAALWVMVFHSFNSWLEVKPDLLPSWLAGFCWHGWLGVHVFFVISGYCIAERTALEYRTRGTVRAFVTDRLLRIFPPYWAAVAVALVLNVLASGFNGAGAASPWPRGGLAWLQIMSATEHWFVPAGWSSYLLVAWTLSFEIGFYLLAAACLGLALRTRRPWTGFALGTGLLLAGFVPAVAGWLPILELWPHFALGGLIWLASHRVPDFSRRLGWGTVVIAVLALSAGGLAPEQAFSFRFAAGCAWLLLALQPFDARLAAAPALRWLGWAGTMSYSIYLIHAPVVGKIRNALSRHWQPGDPGAFWVPLAACGLAVGASWCFYRLVEARTEKWRREYRRHLRPPSLSP